MIKGITLIHPIITANSKTNPYHHIPSCSYSRQKQSLGHKGIEGGRISDTLLSRLWLDPARIDQEWFKCSDLSPLANVDYGCKATTVCPVRCEPRSFSSGRVTKTLAPWQVPFLFLHENLHLCFKDQPSSKLQYKEEKEKVQQQCWTNL
jgi:hypothetical protein